MKTKHEHSEMEPDEKSKSQIKREMEELQNLGEKLTRLNKEQLATIPLEEKILAAIKEHQRLKKNEARRRQMQYIGRLMRDAEAECITEALNKLDASQAEHTKHFHQIELWRERLLKDPQALTSFISEYPQIEVQTLRQLIRSTLKEQKQGKDLGSYRKLFRFLRESAEAHDRDQDF